MNYAEHGQENQGCKGNHSAEILQMAHFNFIHKIVFLSAFNRKLDCVNAFIIFLNAENIVG